MSLTNKEKIVVERLAARGYKINDSQSEAPFTFAISPVISAGVDVSIFMPLSRAIISAIKDKEYKCELNGVVVFPRIVDPAVKKPEKLCSYKRRDNAYYVGIEIDFHQWAVASQSEKLNIALSNMRESIFLIPERHMSSLARDRLIQMILAASATLLSKEIEIQSAPPNDGVQEGCECPGRRLG